MRGAIIMVGGFALLILGSVTVLQEAAAPELVYVAPKQPAIALPMASATKTIEIVQEAIHEVITRDVSWKRGVATVFWVGEDEASDNGFIHNRSSAWDVDWEEHFGGVDDPETRCGFEPCGFVPKENPFYIALPYNDLERGRKKENAHIIPWNDPSVKKSVVKNRWIAVRSKAKVCYGQWQDVGPFEENDTEYVFGDAETPKNTLGMRAGIDLSPAMRDCLGVGDVSTVEWRHVDDEDVPQGPWTKIVTERP
jgi:hypothetical protein